MMVLSHSWKYFISSLSVLGILVIILEIRSFTDKDPDVESF